jgi:hypothetical protein
MLQGCLLLLDIGDQFCYLCLSLLDRDRGFCLYKLFDFWGKDIDLVLLVLVVFFVESLVFELDADYLHASLHDFDCAGGTVDLGLFDCTVSGLFWA